LRASPSGGTIWYPIDTTPAHDVLDNPVIEKRRQWWMAHRFDIVPDML
jgi:hypothetical protein